MLPEGLLDKLYYVRIGVCIEIDVDSPTGSSDVSGDLRMLGDMYIKDFIAVKDVSHVRVSFALLGV